MQSHKKGKTAPLNKITIDENFCKGCHLCIDQCPKDVLAVSSKRNAKGYLVPKADRTDECIGCQLCEMICPDMAISVEIPENEK
jgi:2-oxoglutarate ferredoxin oxidoreductase subunit delta